MPKAYFFGKTLDDVMKSVIEEILAHGTRINPTKGGAKELTGVLLELTNPRARLSRTETRGKPYSCLGELCWYLAKRKDLTFISYYIPAYKQYADGDNIVGGYGPRLFEWKGVNQVENVTSILRRKPDTRQAVIQLFDAEDIVGAHKDVPCACTLQFMIRDAKLQMFINMRSNDAYWGLPHDVFSFTMLQEVVAQDARNRDWHVQARRWGGGGSLHLYDKSVDAAQQFLGEGWQSTETPMPPMPANDPWPALNLLLKAESDIRTIGTFDARQLDGMNPYWADLIRLLQVFRYCKEKCANTQQHRTVSDQILRIRERISSDVYLPFIDTKLSQLS